MRAGYGIKHERYLGLFDIVIYVFLITCLVDEDAQSRHQLNIFDLAILSFQLEIGVDGKVHDVKKPKEAAKRSSVTYIVGGYHVLACMRLTS